MLNNMLASDCYLVLSKRLRWHGNGELFVRLTTKTPSLRAGEVAVKLTVAVPKFLFDKPLLKASITIPEDQVTPPTLEAKVVDNLREVMEQQTGMKIELAVVEPQAQIMRESR